VRLPITQLGITHIVNASNKPNLFESEFVYLNCPCEAEDADLVTYFTAEEDKNFFTFVREAAKAQGKVRFFYLLYAC
jgi:hypothetical protein